MDARLELREHERWHAYELYIRGKQRRFFGERQIWWFACGYNIGDEENGKGEKFARPLLVLRKFNRNIFWGLPLTSQSKQGPFYLKIKGSNGFESSLILSQLRLYDSKRLIDRIDTLDKASFSAVKLRLKAIL